jgi:O-methyltransferase involved in polyketide biosynthesis
MPPPDGIDTSVPHPARTYDYWLGGKDNYAADRAVGDEILRVMPDPDLRVLARINREFLGRAVRHLAGEAGIRQFLDIGTGLPTANNTHEVAQAVAPECRIVYVDNDPLVLVHARALLVGAPEGATDYIQADLREPDKILREAANTLDLSQPVALMLLGILDFIPDADGPEGIVRRLLDGLPSGSYLVAASHLHGEAMDRAAAIWNESGAAPITIRSIEEFTRFFDGLEFVEPGAVSQPQWRPDPGTLYGGRYMQDAFGAVGRKP